MNFFLIGSMRKIPFIAAIVLSTVVAIIFVISFFPSTPTLAEIERNMITELSEMKDHGEKAKWHACDLYATVYASCIMRKDGACAERSRVETDYAANFSADPRTDCEPPKEGILPDDTPLNDSSLFFGDESGNQ